MSDNTSKAVMYIIRNGNDARAISEILAVNGYKVQDVVDVNDRRRHLVYVAGGSVEDAAREENMK